MFFLFYKVEAQKFDVKDFNEKASIAEWLLDYDLAAWWSTDSLLAKENTRINQLGREWFCFKDSTNVWHSIYGKYENGVYNQIFHFVVRSSTDVKESSEILSQNFLIEHAKALTIAFEESKSIRESSGLRFNHYIKKNERGNFDVYIFPAFQPNGLTAYGGEFIYEITPESKIVKNNSYFQGEFKGFKSSPPREIWLNYTELEKPTLGSIFFAWYYKSYFTKIMIDNNTSFSTPFKDDNNWTWIHVEKDLKKKGIKQRAKKQK